MIKQGSKVKAARDITWGVVLTTATPSAIIDSVLVPIGTSGTIVEHDKSADIYLVEFEDDQEWWLTKEDLANR